MCRKIVMSGIVAVVLALPLTAAQVRAQSTVNGPGTPTILQAINDVQATLTTLQDAVAALTPAAESNVRFTPPLILNTNDGLSCAVINVGTAPHKIRAVIVNALGIATEVLTGDVPLQPGNSASGGATVANVGLFYCQYTVLDGTRADIRGTAQHRPGGTGLGQAIAAE